MAQLIVRRLEDKVVRKLKERAAKYGVSMEEEHRRILREILMPKEKPKPKLSFKEYLLTMPYFGDDDTFEFKRDKRHRKVDLGA
jgi:antitoxin FitA